MHKLTAAAAVFAVLALAPAAHAADMSSVAKLERPAPGGKPWTASQIAHLKQQLTSVLQAPTLRGAQVGVEIVDTERKTAIWEQNADQEFMPASNFKLLVGSVVLDRLGPQFAYTTTVRTDGTNVFLRGGGDALLSAADLDGAAAALASQGVKSVADVVTDASHFDTQRYGYGWSWDDLPYYYAPVVSALGIEDHIVHIYMTPGAAPGAPVQLRVEPQSDSYTIDNRLTTADAKGKDTSDIARVWDQPRTIRLSGTYPLGMKESGDIRAAVPDPESNAGDVFAKALRKHGITVTGSVHSGLTPATSREVWNHPSETMPQLLADFWYPSDNLMGELFLKQLGVSQAGEPGTDDNGIKLEQAWLKSAGVNPDTLTISDGSGLSQYDRITPRDFVSILQHDWAGPNRAIVLDAMPVSGVRGTLGKSYVGTPAEKMVWAKTGSISHVRTISGYVKTKTHGPVTVSFLINQWNGEDRPTGAADLAKVRAAFFSQIAGQ